MHFLTGYFLKYFPSFYTGLLSLVFFSQIALQFPDSLLVDSTAVASLIEKNTGKKVFVLADTSYGRYTNSSANLKC